MEIPKLSSSKNFLRNDYQLIANGKSFFMFQFQVAKLTGHHYRVLYLAMSPDGESIVTGAGDETLRFWNVFSKARSQKVSNQLSYLNY